MAPHLLQQNVEAARARADEADLQRIMRAGLGPLDTGDEEALWVRVYADCFGMHKLKINLPIWQPLLQSLSEPRQPQLMARGTCVVIVPCADNHQLPLTAVGIVNESDQHTSKLLKHPPTPAPCSHTPAWACAGDGQSGVAAVGGGGPVAVGA